MPAGVMDALLPSRQTSFFRDVLIGLTAVPAFAYGFIPPLRFRMAVEKVRRHSAFGKIEKRPYPDSIPHARPGELFKPPFLVRSKRSEQPQTFIRDLGELERIEIYSQSAGGDTPRE